MRISKDPMVRKGELIEAAEALFREEGYRQTSVSDIVKRIGVAQGTFYYYFKSKDDVLDAVIDYYIEGYQRAIERLIADDRADPARKIEIIANTALSINQFYPRLAEFLHSAENQTTHQRYIVKYFGVVIPQITAVVEQGKAAGIFRVGYPRESVEMLVYAFGYLEESIAGAGDQDHYERMIRAAEEILARVLGVEPGRLHLDPSGSENVLQIVPPRDPKPEA
ncbi:MAG TPA: TetR/AcrR family transcriptional regulator [Methanocella sp.]|nr:TetR/AcrR family transcriptional regulator [Methanocella sp.]